VPANVVIVNMQNKRANYEFVCVPGHVSPSTRTALQVMEARKRELGRLRQAVPARVGMQVLLFSTPTLAAVFAFAAYGSASPNDFTAPHIFSAIAYFAIMRFPLIFLPFALVQARRRAISLWRMSVAHSLRRVHHGCRPQLGLLTWSVPMMSTHSNWLRLLI